MRLLGRGNRSVLGKSTIDPSPRSERYRLARSVSRANDLSELARAASEPAFYRTLVYLPVFVQEQDNFKNSDALRRQLEVELRDVTARLEEAESVAQKEAKRLIAKLQAKVNTTSQLYSTLARSAVFALSNVNVNVK